MKRKIMLFLLGKYLSLLILAAAFSEILARHPTTAQGSGPSDDASNMKVTVTDDGMFSIDVRGTTWLSSAPVFFNADGTRYTQHANLEMLYENIYNGTDKYGDFVQYDWQYKAGRATVGATIYAYTNQPFAVFSQIYFNGANETQTTPPPGIDGTVSGFPSFYIKEVTTKQGPLGYLNFGGIQSASSSEQLGIFSPAMKMNEGMEGGPLCLFDGSGDALIISPQSTFMATSFGREKTQSGEYSLNLGVMGGAERIPAIFAVEVVVYYSSKGVNRAFQDWGKYLRNIYDRTDAYVLKDMSLNYLGYWTDNGAYYYYRTEPQKNYEQTILDVKTYADKTSIPYKYVQYDSWWYFKGQKNGVKTWQAMPSVFPDGFEYVYKKTGLPSFAHNRYWSNDTTYATQNGGQYKFIVEDTGYALPTEERFWVDLLHNSSRWGLFVYEQDWLNTESGGLRALTADVRLGAMWLDQMAEGALLNSMTIQYCMSEARHLMYALTLPVVTQARASNDYHAGTSQWKIGVSSMLVDAMGIRPSKDNFWTTTVQPNRTESEPNTDLQVIVSVLSMGPVGPSDAVGYTNVTRLMRCCNADGMILKPSKPATAIDDQLYKEALNMADTADGEVWSTFSVIGDYYFGIVAVLQLNGQYVITPTKAGLDVVTSGKQVMVYESGSPAALQSFSQQQPLTLSGTDPTSPRLYHVTPVLTQNPEIVLLGETSKIVPLSPQRVKAIQVSGNDVTVTLAGVPGEKVDFSFAVASKPVTVTCQISTSRTATANISTRSCK